MRQTSFCLFGLACWLALLAFSGCGHGGLPKADAAAGQDAKPNVVVRVARAQQRTIAERVTGLGHCEALPDHAAMLTAAAEGRVVALLVQPGGSVDKGQAVVVLDTSLAQANLAEKKSARDAQEASNKVLNSLPREEELKSARLAIEQAQLAEAKAQATVNHLLPLRQRGEVSESAFQEADVALHQAQLQLKTAETQLTVLSLPPRAAMKEEALAKIKVADAAVASAQVQFDQLTIRAPLAGVLDNLNCQIGQTLSVGNVVGQVVDAKQVYVVAWLSVADARRVKLGAPAVVRQESRAADKEAAQAQAVQGRVVSIGSVTDPQTGNLPVRILLDNSSGQLTLGQIGTISVSVAERKVLAVPAAALFDLGDGPLVNVVRDGKTVVLHPKIGQKDDDWVEVADVDLKSDESVIIDGGYNLPEGSAVAVEKGEK